MSQGVVDMNGRRERPADADASVPEVLDQVRDSALRLIAELPRPPYALRVRAGDVSVEVEWNLGTSAPAVTDTLPAVPATVDPLTVPEDRHCVGAPTVGLFYRAPEPGAPPFVTVGDLVRPEQQVGIVEAMKLMIPVVAERGGRVLEIVKDDGAPVEYGEGLIVIAPDDDG
ncbi:biotin/lipoyl-containing protein [Micromonosporaceae bacterium B7E4]